MPVEACNSRFVSFRGESFDAIAEMAQGWEMDYHQLDAGPNPSDLTQLRLGGVDVGLEHVARTVQISGRPPPGSVVFALRDAPGDGWVFRGRATDADTLAVIRPGDELDARLQGGLLSFVADLNLLARRLGRTALRGAFAHDRIVLRRGEADVLRRLGHGAVCAARSDTAFLESPGAAEDLADGILDRLAAAVRRVPDMPEAPGRPGPRPVRIAAARRADEFIRANLQRCFTVGDLTHVAGVGERALRLGFAERFGHGPKAHATALRLNAIRRALRSATAPQSVTRIAARFDVGHLGDFAVRYRRLFGESPSETLKTPQFA